MTERTLREKIQTLIDRQYSIDPDDLQAILDAHTTAQPAPDAVAEARPSQAVGSFLDMPADERNEFERLLGEAFAALGSKEGQS